MLNTENVALVTGAAGNGMGRSIALTLARYGVKVAVNYLRHREKAEEIVSHIRRTGGEAVAFRADVFDRTDCEKLVADVIETFGKVDICVIGPGADWNAEAIADLPSESCLKDLRQEVAPVYHLLPPLFRDMKRRSCGRIVGISSNLHIPSPSYSYNVAKAARTEALLRAADEAWTMGITVNVIAPGPVGPFSDLRTAAAFCGHGKEWTERKSVTPQDIAEGVAFLCSEEARYLSGCVLPYLF